MHYSPSEIESLIKRFESTTLPKSEWTHEAHLAIAVWYCQLHELKGALPIVRKRITEHNSSVGTPNTDTEGYHETITRFWLVVAQDFLTKDTMSTPYEAINAFIASSFSKSDYPLQYYSRDVLFSVKARHEWIGPDLKEIIGHTT